MLKAYKYRIFPNESQKEQLQKFFGVSRFVYNLGLETKVSAYVGTKINLSCFDLINQVIDLKKDCEWINDCPAQAIQMSLRQLDNAYTKFFKGGGFPKFKNKHGKQSVSFPQGLKFNFKDNKIFVPKLKWLTCIYDREVEGEVKTCTLSKTTTGKYFISVLVDNKKELPVKKVIQDYTTVGIDMGVKTFATLSDGKEYENIKAYRSQKNRLKIEQRTLNRRFKKGAKEQSNSYKKQKLVVAKLHEKISNQREDYLHKVSAAIIKQYDTICLEDLNIRGMMKNHKLALAIGEVGWNSFETKLKYKAEWHGKNLLYIGRFEPSSKICSNCGAINKELKLHHRSWSCDSCKANHNRDLNAAINIKNFGLRSQPLQAKVVQ